uniref:Short-chain dehydrogenase/reductase SDR n=1 Tax=Cyanothece sp. (strain PCC 7425 / ATCC 29141) TaxID=395961 RepID=B8HSZ6_CYAP4
MNSSAPAYTLITGASSGIGRATALTCAQAGLPLILLARSVAKLEAVATAARAYGVEVEICPFDLSQVDQVGPQLSEIVSKFTIETLINAAGAGYTAEILHTPLQDWQNLLNLNLTSVFQCIQAVLPQMRSRHQGTIVNVVSIAGRQVFPQWGAYCVSKFGLMALSKTLAEEERPYGIRVISLCPGAVNTSLWDAGTVQADFDRTAMLTPEIVAETILHAIQLPPQAVVEELVLMPGAGTF